MGRTGLIALGDNVIVEPIKAETQTPTGIVVVESEEARPTKGVVLAVGSKVDIDIHAGDTVFYGSYAGMDFKEDGEDRLVISQANIIGKEG